MVNKLQVNRKKAILLSNTNKLLAPTMQGCKDALRPIVSAKANGKGKGKEKPSRMALFNPEDDDYVLKGGVLYYQGGELSQADLIERIQDAKVNKPLQEPVLALGVWSFLNDTKKHDLRNKVTLETTVNEMSTFFGVSIGNKGFRLVEKLKAFQKVYGVILGRGVFPFLEVQNNDGNLVLSSHYLHHALNMMLQARVEQRGEDGKYCSDKGFTSLVSAKNKIAALLVIELINLVVLASQHIHTPHISLRTLASRIPELNAILFGNYAPSVRNKQLRRAFDGIVTLIEEKSSLMKDYHSLKVSLPYLHVSNPEAVIDIHHKGLRSKMKEETVCTTSHPIQEQNGYRQSKKYSRNWKKGSR